MNLTRSHKFLQGDARSIVAGGSEPGAQGGGGEGCSRPLHARRHQPLAVLHAKQTAVALECNNAYYD